MRDTTRPAALQNIEQALALLDRVSRFLAIGPLPFAPCPLPFALALPLPLAHSRQRELHRTPILAVRGRPMVLMGVRPTSCSSSKAFSTPA